MMKARIILAAAVVGMLFPGMPGGTGRAAVPYTVTQIPTPYDGLFITDINELGVVSYRGGGGGGQRGYVWDGTTATMLPGQSPYSQSIAYMLNDSGVVVGAVQSGTFSKAAKWVNGAPQVLDLESMNSTDSVAFAVNNAGLIAGRTYVSNSGRHLFTISPSGAVADHGELPAYLSIMDMNESGQMVMQEAGPMINGYVWQNDTYTRLYDVLGGKYSAPFGINDAGLVVGVSWPNQANAKAVCWQDGQLVRILPVPDGTGESYAYDVNNLGQIVGSYATSVGGTHRACLWDADGSFHDLASMVVAGPTNRLNYAREINDAGQIGVLGINATGYLMNPIPEPATLALLALGGLAVIRRRRR